MTDIQFRPCQPADLPVLKDIMVEAFDGVSIDQGIERRFGEINGRPWQWMKARHLDDDIRRDPHGIIVAECDGEIVGFISSYLDHESGTGSIPNLSLRPQARGRGIGRQLLELALQRFRDAGLTHARIETLTQNEIGNNLYRSVGFEEVARQVHFAMDLAATPNDSHFTSIPVASRTTPDGAPAGFEPALTQFIHLLNESQRKIRHCVQQLDDEQVWKRPDAAQNSIGNILLHMTGNLRQWVVTGLRQEPDRRDRDSEFQTVAGPPGSELLSLVERTVSDAQQVINELDAAELLTPGKIQGFDVTVLEALFHTVPHFVGHTHQIITLTRLWLGDRYEFEWQPDDPVRSGVPL